MWKRVVFPESGRLLRAWKVPYVFATGLGGIGGCGEGWKTRAVVVEEATSTPRGLGLTRISQMATPEVGGFGGDDDATIDYPRR